MKRGLYFVLQFVLSATLLLMGYVIGANNHTATSGAASMLLMVPGAVIFLAMLPEFFKPKEKQQLLFPLIYLVMTVIGFGVAIMLFKIREFSVALIGLIAAAAVITVLICTLFHYIHRIANKKPRIII